MNNSLPCVTLVCKATMFYLILFVTNMLYLLISSFILTHMPIMAQWCDKCNCFCFGTPMFITLRFWVHAVVFVFYQNSKSMKSMLVWWSLVYFLLIQHWIYFCFVWQVQHGGAAFVCKRYLEKHTKTSCKASIYKFWFNPNFLCEMCWR